MQCAVDGEPHRLPARISRLHPGSPRRQRFTTAGWVGVRALGRAWCRVLWRCWQDRVPYDPARHRGLQQHLTVTIPTPSGPVIDQAATKRLAGDALTVPADAPTSRKEPSTRT